MPLRASSASFRLFLPRHDRARRKLAEYAAQGALQPTIAKIFPLSDAPEALRYLIEGRPFGRVLMRVNS
jgi:NADPH:quinone reductase